MRVFVYGYSIIFRNTFCIVISNCLLSWTSGMWMILTMSFDQNRPPTPLSVSRRKFLRGSKSHNLQGWIIEYPSKRRCKTLSDRDISQ